MKNIRVLRKSAKIISKCDGMYILVCHGIICEDCPLYPCNNKKYINSYKERKTAAILWLKAHPSLWEKIKAGIKKLGMGNQS